MVSRRADPIRARARASDVNCDCCLFMGPFRSVYGSRLGGCLSLEL
jgi:hypothetical protein